MSSRCEPPAAVSGGDRRAGAKSLPATAVPLVLDRLLLGPAGI